MRDKYVTTHTEVSPLRWVGPRWEGQLEMLDQRRLPAEEHWLAMPTYREVAEGIREMAIRGAPAIGIAAAYGVALAAREFGASGDKSATIQDKLAPIYEHLAQTRPTAVNLFWALERIKSVAEEARSLAPRGFITRLFEEARAISAEDFANNEAMGLLGADLLAEGARVLTHCNTGGLATGGLGTALGIIRAAHQQAKLEHVWVSETRPYLQGARLSAWELQKERIPATLITDSTAGYLMQQGKVDAVIVGTDRVAANGDMANKIGSYSLAVLCQYHDIPFYVAAPISTIDLGTKSGAEIPIEERPAREVTHLAQAMIAPAGFPAKNPAFDVTPNRLITAIVTEGGVIRAPYSKGLKALQPL